MKKELGQGWINVKDKLPQLNEFNESEKVLIYSTGYFGPCVAYLAQYADCGYVWHNNSFEEEQLDEVTHWMPLPEAPKEN